MRGLDQRTGELFSYVDLEARVRADHPLRPIRAMCVWFRLTTQPPSFPAWRASSLVNLCAVPLACDARPPSRDISALMGWTAPPHITASIWARMDLPLQE